VGRCGGLDYGDWIRKIERIRLDRIGLIAVEKNNGGARINSCGGRIIGGVKSR